MQVATCRANKIDNRQSDTVFDARMKCLDGWLDTFGGAVKTLESATDAATLEGAVKGVASIPLLAHCADVDALLAAERLPDDPAQRAEAKAIIAEVTSLNADRRAGKFEGLVERNDVLITRARRLGNPAALAKALAVRWRISVATGDVTGSLPFMRELTEVAARGGNDHEAANTWALMGRFTAQWLGQPDEARVMMLAARAASARAGDPPDLRAEVLGNEADVLTADGDTAGALVSLSAARDLLITAGADQPGSTLASSLAGVLQGVGEAHMHDKRYDEAVAAFHEAIAILDRAYGPDTVEVAGVYLDLAQVLLYAKRHAEAETAVDVSLRIRSSHNPEAADTATAMSVKAAIVGSAGRNDEAIAMARRSVEIARATMQLEDAEFLAVLSTLGQRLSSAGHYAEALSVMDEALSIADKAKMETDDVDAWRAHRAELRAKLAHP
jgi:eukaryotic-like serine/threonine-protein kinase